MSTKIFNGYRFAAFDLAKLQSLVAAFTDRCRGEMQVGIAELMLRKAFEHADRIAIKESNADEQRFLSVCSDVAKRVREAIKSPYRSPDYDFGCSLSLFPHARTQSTYLILHAEQAAYHAALEAQAGISSYEYWDHTDSRPHGVSLREWRERKALWDELPPAAPFAATIVDEIFGLLPFEAFENAAGRITLEQRAGELARERLVIEQAAKAEDQSDDMNAAIGRVADAHSWLRTDEGQAAYLARTREYMAVLEAALAERFIAEYREHYIASRARFGT